MCKVRDKSGRFVEVSAEQFQELMGDRAVRPHVNGVYFGQMSIEEVPQEHREAVAAVVAAREAFSGPYQVPAAEALAELVEVLG